MELTDFYRYAESMKKPESLVPHNTMIDIDPGRVANDHWLGALEYNLRTQAAGAWTPVSSLSQMSGRASQQEQFMRREHMQNVALNQAQQMQQTAGILGYLKDGNESK